MIKEWLDGYKPKNNLEAKQALCEIIFQNSVAKIGRI